MTCMITSSGKLFSARCAPPATPFSTGLTINSYRFGAYRACRALLRKFEMKKLVLALTAVAAFSGSALAADLPARTYSKAPVMPEPIQNWTGFYLFGGFGYGLWEA